MSNFEMLCLDVPSTSDYSHAADAARAAMYRKGWTQRKAAKFLGRTHTHVSLAMTGKRESVSLLEKIATLPVYQPGMEKQV